MAMAAYVKLILGSFAFAIFWELAVLPTFPCLHIGRTTGSLQEAILMVIFQVLTVDQAYKAIDLPILGLLFGTIVVSGYLERVNAFKYLGKLLTWKSEGAKLSLRAFLLTHPCRFFCFAPLTEPIDIYSEWIDERERVNNVEEEDDDADQDKSYVAPRKRLTTYEWDD